MSEFSLALNEDQLTLQKWLHEFAVDVMRPNAEEWDEKEEFPWPIVQQAADACGHQSTVGVVPRTLADAIDGVDGSAVAVDAV